MQKTCPICTKPIKMEWPAQKYHKGRCADQASRNRSKRYRDKLTQQTK